MNTVLCSPQFRISLNTLNTWCWI